MASAIPTTRGRLLCVFTASMALPLRGASASTQSWRAAATKSQTAHFETQHFKRSVRDDFPILHQTINGKQLLYFDSASTSQKPRRVMDVMDDFYLNHNSGVHRGVHQLSAQATVAYSEARSKVAAFIDAASDSEVVWTRNATEAINLVANTWGVANLKQGDEVILSVAEHHSNLVPWQLLSQRLGIVLKFVRLTPDNTELDMKHFKELLSPRTKLVSLVHVSNTLGAVLDASYVVEEAKKVGALVLLDCCQSIPHLGLSVQRLGVDWVAGSSHKMCGPYGVGFLWGRQELLEQMPPWMGGGEMTKDVTLESPSFSPPPKRFEAGTQAIAEAIGLGAACDYLTDLGMHNVHQFELDLAGYLYDRLRCVPGVTLYGPPPTVPLGRAAMCAFNVEGLHATDVSTLLDFDGVAIRSGHHCTQPLHTYMGINASARASLYIYNTEHEVDGFIESLHGAIKFFKDA